MQVISKGVVALLLAVLASSCGSQSENNTSSPSTECEGQQGTQGCACYGNGTCNGGLTCESGVCEVPVSCEDGSQGCACYGNGTCDDGLTCIVDVCRDSDAPIGMGDMGATNDMDMAPDTVPPAEKVIGAEGGTVALDGVELTIPAGALSQDIPITIRRIDLDLGPRYTLYGFGYEFGPQGLTFDQPIEVSLPGTTASEGASLFWSRKEEAGFKRLVTSFDAGKAVAEIDHFSTGFVAITNPVPLDQFPVTCLEADVSNVKTFLDGGRSLGGVRASFVLKHCGGPPMVQDIPPSQIRVINDESGAPFDVSLEGGGASTPLRVSEGIGEPVDLNIVVAVDLSNSIVDGGKAGEVLDAAQALVDEILVDVPQGLKPRVALQAFGQTSQTRMETTFTSDRTLLTSTIDTLRSAAGRGTTNLYGAYADALREISQAPLGNGPRAGALVLVTDGRHEAGDFDTLRMQALTLRDQSKEQGLSIFTVAAGAPASDLPFIEELATNSFNFNLATNATDLAAAYRSYAEYLRRLPEATYVIGICTPVEVGTPSFTVEADFMGVKATASSTYQTAPLESNALNSCRPSEVADPFLRGNIIYAGDVFRGGLCTDRGCVKGGKIDDPAVRVDRVLVREPHNSPGYLVLDDGRTYLNSYLEIGNLTGVNAPVASSNSCFLMSGGEVRCVDFTNGISNQTYQLAPNASELIRDCALLSNGRVKCHQLDNTLGMEVPGLENIIQLYPDIPPNTYGVVAQRDDGALYSFSSYANVSVTPRTDISVIQLKNGQYWFIQSPTLAALGGAASVTNWYRYSDARDGEHLFCAEQGNRMTCGPNNSEFEFWSSFDNVSAPYDYLSPLQIIHSGGEVASLNIDNTTYNWPNIADARVNLGRCVGRASGAVTCSVVTQFLPTGVEDILTVPGAQDFHMAGGFVCAVGTNKKLVCSNFDAQAPKRNVEMLTNVEHFACNRNTPCCAVRSSGSISCFNELDGPVTDVPNLNDAVSLHVPDLFPERERGNYMCAITTDKSVVCWGADFESEEQRLGTNRLKLGAERAFVVMGRTMPNICFERENGKVTCLVDEQIDSAINVSFRDAVSSAKFANCSHVGTVGCDRQP